MRFKVLFLLAAFLFGMAAPASAQAVPLRAPTSHIEVGTLPPAGVSSFDPVKATDAYLAQVPAAKRAKTDAYFEGGYVLQVVDLIYGLVIAGVLLWGKFSSRMREFAEGVTRHRFWQAPIYIAQYVVVTTVLMLPLAVYEGFFREHKYGLSNQTLGQWAGEFGIGFVIQLIGMTVLLTLIYAAARAARRAWWIWGAGITIAGMVFMMLIAPIVVEPLFNKYTPLPDSGMKNAILSMARANGIPAKNVYVVDASKQTKKVSANVAGLFGTTRIALNDNLLNRGTPSEVLSVLGHEMGHYVMNHVGNFVVWMGLLILFGFWFVDKAFYGLAGIFGGNWDARSIDDPAGLPAVMALISVFFFFATPVTNTMIRTQEIEADIYGLNAVRQPDAFAKVALMAGEYRKLEPGKLEETVFFDHPSGRNRILMAMRWKAEHLNDPDIMAGPISPQ
ncbi:STE24 endopeptidase [Rhizomicrobium palustre]|uniref:STE24 endopeptidase n=1 Tax=Rhizomicrobium palustre TaxID=189966 RepID=A0A846MUH5_9PROT|nr:M48 family metallopeptidase [Rhizomicrobium palustre]NIK86851.1 STE24 endopeptidase [Rhizomicrobium palustre]